MLKKTFTRDSSVILQQAWFNVFDSEIDKFGWINPSEPAIIHYLNNGVIEIWENEEATEWLIDQLLEMNRDGEFFFDKEISGYQAQLNVLKSYWSNGVVEDAIALIEVVDHIFKGMPGFMVMYYSGIDERTPRAIRDVAIAFRDADVFFDENDKLLRQSLRHIYPELSGLEVAVLRSEIARPPGSRVLKERMKNMVFLGESIAQAVTLEQFASEHAEYGFHIEKLSDASVGEITGQIGQPGNVSGKVRIVKRKDQIGSVKKGEIIVSPMTTPDYLPAMKKAAAFVTDEGGITCHAAIVSRELGKPCIIGTKIATQVLKDGDMVEVDADKGIVTVLSRTS